MEVCVFSNMPARLCISSNSGSSTDLSNSIKNSSGDLFVNDRKICFTESLYIEDFEISTNGFNLAPCGNNKCNVVREDECKVSDKRKSSSSASKKCFSNQIAFPVLSDPESSVDGSLGGDNEWEYRKTSEGNGCAKSVDKCYSQPTLPHNPLKLVSAMKGSREKQGITPKKLSVTWDPDVYDPTPTAESHVPSSKNQHYRNNGKKNGRNKQKGGSKSSRGSRGKEKKQARQK